MDWFERLTGFRESSYDDTRRRLDVDDAGCGRASTERATASVNSSSFHCIPCANESEPVADCLDASTSGS